MLYLLEFYLLMALSFCCVSCELWVASCKEAGAGTFIVDWFWGDSRCRGFTRRVNVYAFGGLIEMTDKRTVWFTAWSSRDGHTKSFKIELVYLRNLRLDLFKLSYWWVSGPSVIYLDNLLPDLSFDKEKSDPSKRSRYPRPLPLCLRMASLSVLLHSSSAGFRLRSKNRYFFCLLPGPGPWFFRGLHHPCSARSTNHRLITLLIKPAISFKFSLKMKKLFM